MRRGADGGHGLSVFSQARALGIGQVGSSFNGPIGLRGRVKSKFRSVHRRGRSLRGRLSRAGMMLRFSDNPPMLAPWVRSLGELRERWWVAHTKARCEKAFVWDLLKLKIGHFLPLLERVRFSGGRKRRAVMPLFASYVFFCGTEENRYAALATNRLCRTIEVADQKPFVKELLTIEEALKRKAQLDPYPFAAVGQRCRVTAGPFVGLEGKVVSRSKVARLVLEVGILGQGAAIEIDADLLESIE